MTYNGDCICDCHAPDWTCVLHPARTATEIQLPHEGVSKANDRRCIRCSRAIDDKLRALLEQACTHATKGVLWAVWLSGYCSKTCAANEALDAVAHGMAWWQRRDGGP